MRARAGQKAGARKHTGQKVERLDFFPSNKPLPS